MDFFLPITMDASDHGTKSDPKGTFKLCLQKIFFPQKSIRINDFDH
jgi:hypothetical protein